MLDLQDFVVEKKEGSKSGESKSWVAIPHSSDCYKEFLELKKMGISGKKLNELCCKILEMGIKTVIEQQ